MKTKTTTTTTTATKGKSKITADEVIAARKMYKANPELTMQEIKDKLKLKLSTIMVGRAIRGISHSHIDMCGLPVRPFNVKPAPKKKATKKPAAKATQKKRVAKVKQPATTAAVQE